MKTLQKQSAPVSQCGQTTTPDRYTDFFTREDIESSCRKISRKIKTVYETIVDGSAVFYHKSNLHVVPFDVVKIVSSIDVQNKLDKTIKNIFLSSIYNAEQKCPGSGIICAGLVSKAIEKENFVFGFRKTDDKSIGLVLKNYLDSKSYTHQLVSNSYRMIGPQGRMFFRFSHGKDFNMRTHEGTCISSNKSILFKNYPEKLLDCKVIFIDGIIESVGEIDSVLQQLSNDRTKCCIFARGFAPDVINTLSLNYEKNKLKVFPFNFKAGEDEEVFSFCEKNQIPLIANRVNNDLKMLKVDSLKNFDLVLIENNYVTLSSKKGSEKILEISIPKVLNDQFNTIASRVKFGKTLVSSCAISGICEIKNADFFTSNYAAQIAFSCSESLQKRIDDLHGVLA